MNLIISPFCEGSTSRAMSLVDVRPRNVSLKKMPKKYPSEVPTRASEGKWAFASTRAQAVAVESVNKPIRNAV